MKIIKTKEKITNIDTEKLEFIEVSADKELVIIKVKLRDCDTIFLYPLFINFEILDNFPSEKHLEAHRFMSEKEKQLRGELEALAGEILNRILFDLGLNIDVVIDLSDLRKNFETRMESIDKIVSEIEEGLKKIKES